MGGVSLTQQKTRIEQKAESGPKSGYWESILPLAPELKPGVHTLLNPGTWEDWETLANLS